MSRAEALEAMRATARRHRKHVAIAWSYGLVYLALLVLTILWESR